MASAAHPLGNTRRVGALEQLGLSVVEEAVYQAVLDAAKSQPERIAQDCGIPDVVVASALDTLVGLGLVSQLAGAPTQYSAVPPDLAIGVLVRQREEQLGRVRRVLPELTKRFEAAARADSREELLEVVHDSDTIHQRWLQLQRSATREIRVLDKPPYIDAGNPAEPDLLNSGVGYRTVYDRAALDHPGKLDGIWEAAAAGEDCRIAVGVPIKLFIADDRMALAPLRQPQDVTSAVIVHPSALLDALSALFEAVWQRALPIAAFDKDGVDAVVTDQQRRLLQLLASGCTDETIARYIDIGHRTVQRQISTLMDQFGVQTRFQLGLRAAQLITEETPGG